MIGGEVAPAEGKYPVEGDVEMCGNSDDEGGKKVDSGDETEEKKSQHGELSQVQKKEHQRRHTQNSRAKLNAKFDELLTLIQPMYSVQKKHTPHRSEVLDYAIHAYNDLTERKFLLETELALSSEESLKSYVRNTVQAGEDIFKVLEFYLSMICAKKKWTHGEIWAMGSQPGTLTMKGSMPYKTVNGDQLDLVHQFQSTSRYLTVKPPEDIVGRVYHTVRPEWMNNLSDPEVFLRSQSALAANFKSVFAVPIVDSPENPRSVVAVATFFSTAPRDYDSETVNFATELSASVVSAYKSVTYGQPGPS